MSVWEGLFAAFDGVEGFVPDAGLNEGDDACVAVDVRARGGDALVLWKFLKATYAFDFGNTGSAVGFSGP